jgi:hypothetical protein
MHWWFKIDFGRAAVDPLGGEVITAVRVRVGRLDGTPISDIERGIPPMVPPPDFVGADPFASRAGESRMIYGFFDGRRSEVHQVDVTTGVDSVLDASDEFIIHSAVMSSDGQSLYEVRLEADGRKEAGVWLVRPGQERPAEPIIAENGADPHDSGWFEQLTLSPDDSTLVVRECGRRCQFVFVDTATGRVRNIVGGLPTGVDMYGVTNQEVVYDANCDRPCPAVATNFETGGSRPVGMICRTAGIVPSGVGPFLIHDGNNECLGTTLRLSATAIAGDLPDRLLYEAPQTGIGFVPLANEFGAWLPDGWFMVGANDTALGAQPNGFPALVDVLSGASQALPSLEPY